MKLRGGLAGSLAVDLLTGDMGVYIGAGIFNSGLYELVNGFIRSSWRRFCII